LISTSALFRKMHKPCIRRYERYSYAGVREIRLDLSYFSQFTGLAFLCALARSFWVKLRYL
jgi:hypothetical protein